MATKSTKQVKAVVTIKAPKIVTAWNNVCAVSEKSEADIVKAIENLQTVMATESRLTVADRKKFIQDLEVQGSTSSFVKASHVPALPTWVAMRKGTEGFKALPVAKQLSLAMASYDILGAGVGEQIKSSKKDGKKILAVDNVATEVAKIRKAKTAKRKAGSSVQTDKVEPVSNLKVIQGFTALIETLDFEKLSDAEWDALANLSVVIDNASQKVEA